MGETGISGTLETSIQNKGNRVKAMRGPVTLSLIICAFLLTGSIGLDAQHHQEEADTCWLPRLPWTPLTSDSPFGRHHF